MVGVVGKLRGGRYIYIYTVHIILKGKTKNIQKKMQTTTNL